MREKANINNFISFSLFTFMLQSQSLQMLHASAKLSEFQRQKYLFISEVYLLSFYCFLNTWKTIKDKYPEGFTSFANAELKVCMGQWLKHEKFIQRQDQWICYASFKDAARCLSQSAGSEKPDAITEPFETRVLFYRGFDIKIRKSLARLPLVGEFEVGRFKSFSGRIIAVGLEQMSDIVQCVIAYEPNPDDKAYAL